MKDKIVSFKEARASHDFARKEQKLEAMRSRFKAALTVGKPKKKKKNSKRRKRKK